MGNSFQEQLLKAGLVNKKQVNKAKHEKRVDKKQNKNNTPTDASKKTKQQQLEQKKRINDLNRQQTEQRQHNERQAQIKQLIEKNRLAKDERGEAYNFIDEMKIKRVFVADTVVEQLSSGQAAIVKLGSSYDVVPAEVARQIASRDKAVVLVFHEEQS